MPIAKTLMDALVERYGKDKGPTVYYAMEAEGSGPFGPGGKYRELHEAFAKKHGVPPSHALRTKKKPRRSAGKRRG